MEGELRKRQKNQEALKDAFSSGSITATGERVFVPIRKRIKTEDDAPSPRVSSFSPILLGSNALSDDEKKLIRLQNRIEVEGDDLVPPIRSFQEIGLPNVILQRMMSKGIQVGVDGVHEV